MMFSGIIILLIFLNVVGQYLFFRLDLTSEKRYTLNSKTKSILRDLDELVYIRVYLDGELNISFQKFQDNIRDMLDEFKVYGKSDFQYEFVNPFEDADEELQNRIISDLFDRGLRPTNIHQRDKEGGVSEKIVFPGAILSYRDAEVPLNLLLNNPGQGPEENLNNSIESLEYTLISSIKNITNRRTEKIAFIEGHGELPEAEVNDISTELSKSFQIDRGQIQGQPGVLNDYKAVIIAKPSKPFPETDKFVLDQYLMQGGKILWMIDAVQVSLDSLINGETMAFINDLNLDDLLFRYGVRVNPVLIQDIQCSVLPVNVALEGNTPNFQPAPWLYYPLFSPRQGHPVTQNMNFILSRFANSIDTLGSRSGIDKTVLLQSSEYSRTRNVPVLISLEEVGENPQPADFDRKNMITGVLLEGNFQSAFINRGIDAYYSDPPEIIERGIASKMAVIADGDIIRNDVRYTPQGAAISPLGYDRFTRQTFGNKDFLVNLIHYLADDENLLELRGREFKLRLLDKEKIRSERTYWILFNMLLPPVIVILCGMAFLYIRRRRFAVKI